MRINGVWIGVISIVAGVLVLIFPHLLQWLVGIFLIVVGLLAIVWRR